MASAPAPAPLDDDEAMIASTQALGRADRPLVEYGLNWTQTQVKWAAACLGLAALWLVAFILDLLAGWEIGFPHPGGLWIVVLGLGPLGALGALGRAMVRLYHEGSDYSGLAHLRARLRALQAEPVYAPAHTWPPPRPTSLRAHLLSPTHWHLETRPYTLRLPLTRYRLVLPPPRVRGVPIPWRPTAPTRPASVLIDAVRVRVDPVSGVATRPEDGWLVCHLRVRPIIARNRPGAARRALFRQVRALQRTLPAGHHLQMIVENYPTDIGATNRRMDQMQKTPQPGAAALRTCRRAWVRGLGGAYTPDATYLLVLDGPAREGAAGLLQRRDSIKARLGALGCGAWAPAPAEVAALLCAGATGERPQDTDAFERLAHAADRPAVRGATALRIGDTYLRTIFVYGWPAQLDTEALLGLPLLPRRARLVYTFSGLDQQAALDDVQSRSQYMRSSDLNKRRAAAQRAGRGTSAAVVIGHEEGDAGLRSDADHLTQVHSQVLAAQEALLQAAITITLYAPTLPALEEATRDALRALGGLGFATSRGQDAQEDLYKAALPLARAPYWPLLATTRETGPLFPFVTDSPATGHSPQGGALIGISEVGRQLVHLNLRATATMAAILLGNQGMGKSGTLGALLEYYAQCGWYVTVLDPSGTFLDLISVLDGEIVNLLDPGVAINLPQIAGAAYDNRNMAMLDILEVLLGKDEKGGISAWERAALDAGLSWMYSRAAARGARGAQATPRLRSMDAYFRRAERRARADGNMIEAQRYRDLWFGLAPYVRAGTYASLMDYPTTADLHNQLFQVNTMRFAKSEGIIAKLGLLVATTCADWRGKYATSQGRDHLTLADELYSVMERAMRWFSGTGRTIRHDGSGFIGATHRLSDVTALPQAKEVLTAIKTWIAVRMTEDVDLLMKEWGTPRDVAERVRTLTRTLDNEAQGLFLTELAEQAGAQYGFITLVMYPELMYLLGSYPEQRRERSSRAAAIRATRPELTQGQALVLAARAAVRERRGRARSSEEVGA